MPRKDGFYIIEEHTPLACLHLYQLEKHDHQAQQHTETTTTVTKTESEKIYTFISSIEQVIIHINV